ncbi:hypothetical protein [Vibrio aestuarianus]|uniref:Toxin co-regulated pilus biosynthesis protein D n=1 Tax=Vibrio aestuarianus TaxID=28171 RepID=A0A9X4EUK5_9VIBR|nr:hypothetical protein [Vibrio aestuarianus]MDE1240603.1 hypothetical protein [Vibrio aestuarianus]
MQISLSKTKIYALSTIALSIVMGGGLGAYIFKEKQQEKERVEAAQQQEIKNINSAKQSYLDLVEMVEETLSFSIPDYKRVENEFSNLNLLGWKPVEFKCQSGSCEFKLSTDNKHYVGIPKIALGYENIKTIMSGEQLVFQGINLTGIKRLLNDKIYDKFPSCNDSLFDMRKFIDISGFSLGNGSGQASFNFQQPRSLVQNKVYLSKGNSDYLDIYGIDWNVQDFDWMKVSYISRYILTRDNVGVSAIRKTFSDNGSIYSASGTVYCRGIE